MLSRILIISTSRETAPQPAVPIGAAWVAEALQVAGFTVSFLDLCFQKDPLLAIQQEIDAFQPEGIGLSVRNIDNCDFLSPFSYLPLLKGTVDFIKARSDAPILLGGAGVSIAPRQLLEYLELEYAVVGEGEMAAVAFFGCDARPQDASTIPGVVYKRGAREQAEDDNPLWLPPFVLPRTHRWVDSKRYLALEPVLPVQGKRGCTKRCLYCTYGRIEGRNWRMREPRDVVEEISVAMRHTGAREFEFVDSLFNEPEGYLETLMEEIVRCGVKAKFSISALSPRGLTAKQLRLLERAGVKSVMVTPESASDVTLEALRKDFGEQEVHRAAEVISGSSIRALWCFLLGGPAENDRTLEKTIRFLNGRLPPKDASFITTGIRIYPGTGLHQLAVEEALLTPDDDLLFPTFYFSRELRPTDVRETLLKGVSDPSRCIFPSDTRTKQLPVLRRLGTLLGLPTPFWRYAGYLNRLLGRKRGVRGEEAHSSKSKMMW